MASQEGADDDDDDDYPPNERDEFIHAYMEEHNWASEDDEPLVKLVIAEDLAYEAEEAYNQLHPREDDGWY